mmetsp:Transcript_8128/g.24086  ORF Transcript_8128/g.24086 Transcript_8128/m.24086 type:complete len:200 (+) Transcript_8128:1018-1617(+)
MSASSTGPQQARPACGNIFVASCGDILDIFSRTPSSTASNSSAGERISVRRHVRPMCSAPCEAIARNFSFVMMMPAPRYMSSICCICFRSASGIRSIQSSPSGNKPFAASFPSSPGAARFIFAAEAWILGALSNQGARASFGGSWRSPCRGRASTRDSLTRRSDAKLQRNGAAAIERSRWGREMGARRSDLRTSAQVTH